MNENLSRTMAVWCAGGDISEALAVAFSTSQRCAFALASGRVDLLPEPYDTPGRAWLRLSSDQRDAVRQWNAAGADDAELLAPAALQEGLANHGGPLSGSPRPR